MERKVPTICSLRAGDLTIDKLLARNTFCEGLDWGRYKVSDKRERTNKRVDECSTGDARGVVLAVSPRECQPASCLGRCSAAGKHWRQAEEDQACSCW